MDPHWKRHDSSNIPTQPSPSASPKSNKPSSAQRFGNLPWVGKFCQVRWSILQLWNKFFFEFWIFFFHLARFFSFFLLPEYLSLTQLFSSRRNPISNRVFTGTANAAISLWIWELLTAKLFPFPIRSVLKISKGEHIVAQIKPACTYWSKTA